MNPVVRKRLMTIKQFNLALSLIRTLCNIVGTATSLFMLWKLYHMAQR